MTENVILVELEFVVVRGGVNSNIHVKPNLRLRLLIIPIDGLKGY